MTRRRTPLASFEAKYATERDPWAFDTSPYEQGRYDATIAALGDARFANALELGAARGALTERLAPRCDALTALEPAPTAAATLRERVPDATVVEAALPEGLPRGPFDLIVASEVLYYLDDAGLTATLDALDLQPGGTLLAVHWTGRSPDHVQTGEAVHAVVRARPELDPVRSERHDGFLLDVLQRRRGSTSRA